MIGMSKEHLGVALALNVPIAVCVTKVCPCTACSTTTLTTDRHDSSEHPQRDRQHAHQGAQESRMPPDASVRRHGSAGGRLCKVSGSPCGNEQGQVSFLPVTNCGTMGATADTRLCPIFMVSNVTGHNLPTLRTFLNCLPSAQSDDKYIVDAPFEFQISDVFSVPFVGTVVVSGLEWEERRIS